MLNERLKKIRSSLQLTQKEVAATLGTSVTSYQGYEYGKNIPSADKLKDLHIKYLVNLNWLISGIGPMLRSEEGLMLNDSAVTYSPVTLHITFEDITQAYLTVEELVQKWHREPKNKPIKKEVQAKLVAGITQLISKKRENQIETDIESTLLVMVQQLLKEN